MIVKGNAKSKGSIKKIVEAIERKETVNINKEGEPLTGRIGYYFCSECECDTIHRISTLYSECISCKSMTNLLKGERKAKQLQSMMLF